MHLVPQLTRFLYQHSYTAFHSTEKQRATKKMPILRYVEEGFLSWSNWHILPKQRTFFRFTAGAYLAHNGSLPADWTTGFSQYTEARSSRPVWQQRPVHPLSDGRFLLFLSPWSLLPFGPGVLLFLAFWTGNSHEKKQWEFHYLELI